MWRASRITLLLLVLAAVAAQAWLDKHRTTSWQRTVWVGVFPLNADGSAAAAAELRGLTDADFLAITDFLRTQARTFGVSVDRPVEVRLYESPGELPPQLMPDSGWWHRLSWSLQLRWYRWRTLRALERSQPQIALYLLYYDPERHPALPHSTGLQRGLTGIVHLYAGRAQHGANQVVTTHELLHTFGATDKYDLASNAPLYPDGYADPQKQPRLPQSRAEIMAGRIPISADEQVMAASLDETVIGARTAAEIGWAGK